MTATSTMSVKVNDSSKSLVDNVFTRDDVRVTSKIQKTEEIRMKRRWSSSCEDRLPPLTIERKDGIRKMADPLNVRRASLPKSGVQLLPDFNRLNKAYGIPVMSIPEISTNHNEAVTQ